MRLEVATIAVAAAAAASGCAGAAQGRKCGTLGACEGGLQCVHGGLGNLGTCERPCRRDAECPASQHCELFPEPDALPNVCVDGPRFSLATVVVASVSKRDAGFEIMGVSIERRRFYALVAATPGAGLVRVVGPASGDCDHCPAPRHEAEVVEPPRAAPLVALGPVDGPLPRAVARRFVAPIETRDWTPQVGVDVDGDGSLDVEEVARCDHEVRSGCNARVCDRICRGTRTVGRGPVRAVVCADFVPDVEDCVPESDR